MWTGTYNRLHLHVSASDRAVIRAARLVIDPLFQHSREHREGRHAFFRAMLDNHQRARRIVEEYRL